MKALRLPQLRKKLELQKRAAPPSLPRPTLGQRIQAHPTLGDVENKLAWGTVTYIHETHYWYTITFDTGYRQSYQWGCTR